MILIYGFEAFSCRCLDIRKGNFLQLYSLNLLDMYALLYTNSILVYGPKKKIKKLYSWTKLTCIIHLKKTMRKELRWNL